MANSVWLVLFILITSCCGLPVDDLDAFLSDTDSTISEDLLQSMSYREISQDNATLSERDADPYYSANQDGEYQAQQISDSRLIERDNSVQILGQHGNSTHVLAKRGCAYSIAQGKWVCDDVIPTMSEIISWMRDKPGGTVNKGRMAVFYVNLRDEPALKIGGDLDEAKLVGWLDKNKMGGKYYWWGNCADHHWIEAQTKHLKENRAKIEAAHPEWKDPAGLYFKGIFQGMALAATDPVALLFTKKGIDWKPETVWQTIEFPTLTRNEKIKQIYRVDPNCPSNKPELLWKKGQPKPPLVFQYPDTR